MNYFAKHLSQESPGNMDSAMDANAKVEASSEPSSARSDNHSATQNPSSGGLQEGEAKSPRKGDDNRPAQNGVKNNAKGKNRGKRPGGKEENGSPRKDSGKRSGQFRFFVGNLSSETTEEDIRSLFGKYQTSGNPLDVFFDKSKWFAFVRMENKEDAEKAKKELDGIEFKKRVIRVRYAPTSVTLVVKNLGQNVSNELLHRAFEKFGDLERAVVVADERGRPSGEGLVTFNRKDKAQSVMNRINDGAFFLGTTPRPIFLEMQEQKDDDDGVPEVHVLYRPNYKKEITEGPRFAQPGSMEFELAQRWKRLYQDHQTKLTQLNNMFRDAVEQLEKEMERSVEDIELSRIRQTIAQKQLEMQQLQQLMERRGQRDPANSRRVDSHQNHSGYGHMPASGVERNVGLPIPPPGFDQGGSGYPGAGGLYAGPLPVLSAGPGAYGSLMDGQGPRQSYGLAGDYPGPAGGQFDHSHVRRFDEGINSMGDRSFGSGKRGGGNYYNNDMKRHRK